jgi:hypothetical protein
MAEATFTLRAVDSTKQAFASVQNKLSSLQKTAKTVSVGLATFFGFSAAIGGVKRLDAFLEDAERNAKKLGLTSEDLDQLTIATDFADQAAMQLQTTAALAAAKLAGAFSSGDIAAKAFEIRLIRAKDAMKPLNDEATDLQRQFDDLGKSESLMASEAMDRAKAMRQEANTVEGGDPIEAARKRNQARKLELDATKSLIEIDKKYAVSLEAFGVAQSKLYEGNVSASERLVGLRAQEYELLKQTSSADKSVSTEALEKLVTVYEKINDLQIEQGRLSMEAGAMIAQGFEDAILSGQKLSEVVRALGRDLVRLVFQQMVTQRLAAGVTGVLQGKGFAGFMADGGPVSAGSSYVVGEKGPELFVPHASGTIVPNNKMGGGSGSSSGGVTVNYNIAAGVSRAELAPILEQERRRLKAEIPDMVRRGGGYRAAFA